MIMTGKRHRFLSRYEAGFDNEGRLLALRVELNSDAGMATDLSHAIMERAMLHTDNAYFVPNFAVVSQVWKTNLPSNTAFRGFGGPQGMLGIDYSFKWGGVMLAYRNLYYDQKDDKLLQDLRFTGPALGVTFRF